MALKYDVIAEIEAEMKRASAKSSGGNANFLVLKNGQKALVRPLLNLDAIASVLKHEYYNPSSQKYEIEALCAETSSLDLSGMCKHCAVAKQTNNKKLEAIKVFVIPVWVYAMKDSANQNITYTDQQGKEQLVSGIRYIPMKPSSDILAALMAMWKEGTDLTSLDMTIIRSGEKFDTKYTVLPRAPKPFDVPNVPVQSAEAIILRIAELNPIDTIDRTPSIVQSASSPAQVQAAQPGKVSNVPDF